VSSAAAAVAIAEAVATSDVPAGVVNILTGDAEELAGWIAEHRDIAAVVAADPDDDLARRLRAGAAENFKRVACLASQGAGWLDHDRWSAPETLEAFLEIKTLWHPSSV
jgi:acyl-CoA reductase-like NAD-dependent aldehyde dehydrogenase